jgi:hypothetical protein
MSATRPPLHPTTGSNANLNDLGSKPVVVGHLKLSATAGKVKGISLPLPHPHAGSAGSRDGASTPTPFRKEKGADPAPLPTFIWSVSDATRRAAPSPTPLRAPTPGFCGPGPGIAMSNPSFSSSLKDGRATPFAKKEAPKSPQAASVLVPSASAVSSATLSHLTPVSFAPAPEPAADSAASATPFTIGVPPAPLAALAQTTHPTTAASAASTTPSGKEMPPAPLASLAQTPHPTATVSAAHPDSSASAPPSSTPSAPVVSEGQTAEISPPSCAIAPSATPPGQPGPGPSGAPSIALPLVAADIRLDEVTDNQRIIGRDYLIEVALMDIKCNIGKLKASPYPRENSPYYQIIISHRETAHLLYNYTLSPFLSPLWKEICSLGYLLSKEQDPNKISSLRADINQLLSEVEKEEWEILFVKAVSGLSEMELQYELAEIPVGGFVGEHPLLNCPTYHYGRGLPTFFRLPNTPLHTFDSEKSYPLDPKLGSDSFQRADAPTNLRLFRHAMYYKYRRYFEEIQVYCGTVYGALLLLKNGFGILTEKMRKLLPLGVASLESSSDFQIAVEVQALRDLIFNYTSSVSVTELCYKHEWIATSSSDYRPDKTITAQLFSSQRGIRAVQSAKGAIRAIIAEKYKVVAKG